MNRRSFLRNSTLALFGFAVLPPATTYERVWRAEYRCVMERPISLYSQTITCIVELPEKQLTIENFSIEDSPMILTDRPGMAVKHYELQYG